MTKQQLIAELQHETLVALQPSPVHGIGVFAIAAIPAGFDRIFSHEAGQWIKLPISEAENLPSHARALLETYCLYDETDYFVPEYGFKIMDLVNYLNHSSEPNVESVNDGESFRSLRDIAPGEELLIDYSKIVIVDGY